MICHPGYVAGWPLIWNTLAEGERGPERQIALFKVVNGLADSLRGVFVPYYRHLVDLAASHLAGGKSDSSSKKKKRRISLISESPDATLLRHEVRALPEMQVVH